MCLCSVLLYCIYSPRVLKLHRPNELWTIVYDPFVWGFAQHSTIYFRFQSSSEFQSVPLWYKSVIDIKNLLCYFFLSLLYVYIAKCLSSITATLYQAQKNDSSIFTCIMWFNFWPCEIYIINSPFTDEGSGVWSW